MIIHINEDFDDFIIDDRGSKKNDSFWDRFPDLELEVKHFIVQECSKKEASFSADTLAWFIDERFYQITELKKVDSTLIRSPESCRLNLRRFGAKYIKNKGRPYFLGHEREDVVNHRKDFVKYFLFNEDRYNTLTNDLVPQWKFPKVTQLP